MARISDILFKNKAEIQSLINKVFDTKKQINDKLIDLKEKGDKEGISKEINDLNQKYQV